MPSISQIVATALALPLAVSCAGCQPAAENPGGRPIQPQAFVSFQPAFTPVSLSINSAGEIGLQAEASVSVLIGTFRVGTSVCLNPGPDYRDGLRPGNPDAGFTHVFIRDKRKADGGIDTVYNLRSGGQRLKCTVSGGKAEIDIQDLHILIDVSESKDVVVTIANAGSPLAAVPETPAPTIQQPKKPLTEQELLQGKWNLWGEYTVTDLRFRRPDDPAKIETKYKDRRAFSVLGDTYIDSFHIGEPRGGAFNGKLVFLFQQKAFKKLWSDGSVEGVYRYQLYGATGSLLIWQDPSNPRELCRSTTPYDGGYDGGSHGIRGYILSRAHD